MSGEPTVVLGGGTGSEVARLVAAIEPVARVLDSRCTLVGGLAVMCRLAQAHRATVDLDFVTDDVSPSELVVEHRAGVADPAFPERVVVEGMKVDFITTAPLPSDVNEVEPPAARLFVLSHRWAYETGRVCRIEVVGTGRSVGVRVATPAALVATKLHALLDRRAERAHKRSSDANDLYRLLDRCDADGDVARAFGSAPADLALLVGERVEALFVRDPEDTVRILRKGGDEAYRTVAPDDLRRVGESFLAALPD